MTQQAQLKGNTFTALPPNTSQTNGVGVGLIYNETITGPQHKTANKWQGDYGDGAYFQGSANLNSYCLSQYTVTSQANVGVGTLNPVRTNYADLNCTGWFLFDNNGGETAPNCLFVEAVAGEANGTDVQLATLGTAGLSNGNAWAAEMGLYDKFAGNNTAGVPPVIQEFVQQRAQQAAGQMYLARHGLAAILSPVAPVWETLQTLRDAKVLLLDALGQLQASGTPDSLASQYEALEALESQFAALYAPEAARLALAAQNLQTASDGIGCNSLPAFAGMLQLSVIDAFGRTVEQKTIAEGTERVLLFVADRPAGLYVVRLDHADGSAMAQTKLMITH